MYYHAYVKILSVNIKYMKNVMLIEETQNYKYIIILIRLKSM